MSLAKDVVITGRLPDAVNVAFHVVLAAMCIVAILVRRRRVQATLGIAGAAAIAVYIALLFARLR